MRGWYEQDLAVRVVLAKSSQENTEENLVKSHFHLLSFHLLLHFFAFLLLFDAVVAIQLGVVKGGLDGWVAVKGLLSLANLKKMVDAFSKNIYLIEICSKTCISGGFF